MKKIIFCSLLIFLLFVLSCESENSNIVVYDYHPPMVNGIIITHEESPEEIGRWGEVYYPKDPDNSIVASPYPNPMLSPGGTIIDFVLERSSVVAIYIVPAIGAGEPYSNSDINMMTYNIKNMNRPIRTLINNETLSIGYYREYWDGKDGNNMIIPEGFYRIYFKIDSQITWRDVLVFNREASFRRWWIKNL